VQQVSYGPLIMSIMSCYTGFFNVRQSLNTGPQFYLRLIRRTGWLLIYTSCTTDGCPFKPKKLSVPFLCPGVPAGLYWWIEDCYTYYLLLVYTTDLICYLNSWSSIDELLSFTCLHNWPNLLFKLLIFYWWIEDQEFKYQIRSVV